MNSIASLTAGQVLDGTLDVGSVAFLATIGVLSIRATVRIVYHWNEYPRGAKKIQGLVMNILFAIGSFCVVPLAILVCRSRFGFPTKFGFPTIAMLSSVGCAFSVIALSLLFIDDKMPNCADEIAYRISRGHWLPMHSSGYNLFPG